MSRLCKAILFAIAAVHAADVRDAVAALQRGDFVSAERTLRAELASRPDDAAVLSLLGTALDAQNRPKEADPFHRRALSVSPKSADVLGNYGNHLLRMGDREAAREAFLEIVALDPGNRNANLQMARIAMESNRGAEAVECLKRSPEALSALLENADPRLSFSLGVVLGNAGLYEKSEIAFTRALAAAPEDASILFNLAAAADGAGHVDRAAGVLENILRTEPQNVEALYRLASVRYRMRQLEPAIGMAARAGKLEPRRAEVQKLLALATGDLGALDDSIAAWDRYLKLEPADEVARRERAYTATRMGNSAQGIAELERYLALHPENPDGHYELAIAKEESDPAQALAQFDKAIALKPDFVAARSARGGLQYQLGKPEAGLADLEAAARLRPDDAVTLDRLGQTYLALDRVADAVRALRRAAELAPNDSKTQLHFARALADAGETAESKRVMDRFRQLGPAAKQGVPAGLVDYLSMTPAERQADYRARVEKAMREKPDDAAVQVAWLKVQIEEGKLDQTTARRILSLKPPEAVMADAGRALLAAHQYALAREFLNFDPEASIATFRALDAEGRFDDAKAAIDEAMRTGPRTEALVWNAVAVLVRNGRTGDALQLLEPVQQDGDLLMKAALLAIAGRAEDARHVVNDVQSRRPEWEAVRLLGNQIDDPEVVKRLLMDAPPREWPANAARR